MEFKYRFKCPDCGCDKFYLNAESVKRGDKPTEVECAGCGATFSV